MAFVSHNHREPTGTYVFSSRPRAVESRSRYKEAPAEQDRHWKQEKADKDKRMAGKSNIHTISSRPTVVEPSGKYKDGTNPQLVWTHGNYGNIMYDRRVVRGNTYAQHIIPASCQVDHTEVLRQQEQRRRALTRKREREQCKLRTPEPLQGRRHVDVQTEQYLEELSNVIVATEVDCQTDPFQDRPASPLFIPAKSGKDVETQIEEGELFDFDREVQPMLEVLVGKTIEQSLLEVMEEEELAYLKTQQRAFQELRNLEQAEVQRLQEQERRSSEEKARRMDQQRQVLQRERETAERIAVQVYTQQYLADLLPCVYTSLRDYGYFHDPLEKDLESNFLPWLMDEVNNTLDIRQAARQLLDSMIYEVAQQRVEVFREPETQPEPEPSDYFTT